MNEHISAEARAAQAGCFLVTQCCEDIIESLDGDEDGNTLAAFGIYHCGICGKEAEGIYA